MQSYIIALLAFLLMSVTGQATGPIFSKSAASGQCLSSMGENIGVVLGNNAHTIQVRLTFPQSAPSGTGASRQWLLNLGQRTSHSQHWLWNSQTRVQFGSWNGAQIQNVEISKCSDLITTYSGSVLKLYCDGVFMAEVNTYLSISTSSLDIGKKAISAESDFAGCISEVKIWSSEKSAQQVANLRAIPYLENRICGKYQHVSASLSQNTNSPEKCATYVMSECSYKEFFTWRSTNNACHCVEELNCDNPIVNNGLNVYRTQGLTTEKTVVAVELSANALQVVTDIGEKAFNQKFKACPVVQYNRNGAVHSVYKRITPIPENFNAYKIFTDTWRNTPQNTMGTDFEIFSTVNDLLNDQNEWTFCNYNDPDVAYPRDCGRNGWVPNQWFSMPGGIFNARGVSNGAGFTLFNECPIDFAFLEECRWESNHDQTPNSDDYMGWTCADNEILTGFGLSANEHDITKVQCCKLGGHSAVKSNTCTYVDSNHKRAKCGNGNDHMVFSGAYDKSLHEVDAVTEVLVGKCCEVECDSAWCSGKDWGVDKDNCQVISTSNTIAQELVCPSGTLLTQVEDGLTGNAHGVQKVASITCCALDLVAPPTFAPSAAPTTSRPTFAPSGAPSTSMPSVAPTTVEDCLLALHYDSQLTDAAFLQGIDECLPGCFSTPHRRALESRLLSENNRRQ